MPRKPKAGSLKHFLVRDTDTNEVVRREDGSAVYVTAYTPKAAKHQGKAITGRAVLVEQAA